MRSIRRWGPVAFGLVAIAVAHLPLSAYDPGGGDLEGLEDALFEPTSASPVIVAICWLGLLYLRGPRLRGFEGRESPAAGTLLLLLGGALCLWAHYVGVEMLLVVSLSLMVLGSGLLLGGAGAFRTLLFPSLFLLLAVPVPTPIVNGVMYPLQLANAQAAGFVLELVGFAPIVSGDLIILDKQVFQVIESCSGLRMTLVVVMSACIYTELAWHDRRRSFLLIASSPLIAVLANHLRIMTIIFNPYASFSTVHTVQGLVMIVVAVVLIALLDVLLARVSSTVPEPHLEAEEPTGRLPLAVGASYAVICASLAIASLGLTPWSPAPDESVPLVEIKADLPGWQTKGFEPDDQFLGSVRYDAFIAHRYGREDTPSVDLFVASDHRLDPMLGIGSAKTLIPARGGEQVEVDFDLGSPEPFIDAALVRFPGKLQLVYHWKVGLGSRWEEVLRAVLGLDRGPLRRPGRAVFVRLSTAVEPGEEGVAGAISRLQDFVEELRGDFERTDVWPRPVS